MIKNKKWIYGILAIASLVLTGIGLFLANGWVIVPINEEKHLEKEAGVSNPAVVYCKNLGYKLEAANCIFPDGSKCEEWSFFRGKCGQQFTFCVKQGFSIKNLIDNMGTWTAEYAVCTFDDDSECLEQDYFEGKCSRSECKKWKMSEGGCVNSQ
ncbi:DUF333 domain-containing protein [Candidatus Woesearchaeota archaeon]|nr:DUF333 domain-containing protein [Candidatus Woesearchaeota archaeon]